MTTYTDSDLLEIKSSIRSEMDDDFDEEDEDDGMDDPEGLDDEEEEASYAGVFEEEDE